MFSCTLSSAFESCYVFQFQFPEVTNVQHLRFLNAFFNNYFETVNIYNNTHAEIILRLLTP